MVKLTCVIAKIENSHALSSTTFIPEKRPLGAATRNGSTKSFELMFFENLIKHGALSHFSPIYFCARTSASGPKKYRFCDGMNWDR